MDAGEHWPKSNNSEETEKRRGESETRTSAVSQKTLQTERRTNGSLCVL